MNPDKQILLDDLHEKISASPFLFVADFNGLTMKGFIDLRKRLKEVGAECHVQKNSYVRKIAEKLNYPGDLGSFLTGQTALLTGDKDAPGAAKVATAFTKETQKGRIKAGILDGKFLKEEDVTALATLPSREVLLAQILGVLNAPASKLVRTINEPGSALARVLKAKFDAAAPEEEAAAA